MVPVPLSVLDDYLVVEDGGPHMAGMSDHIDWNLSLMVRRRGLTPPTGRRRALECRVYLHSGQAYSNSTRGTNVKIGSIPG